MPKHQSLSNSEYPDHDLLFDTEEGLQGYNTHVVSMIYKALTLHGTTSIEKSAIAEFGAGHGTLVRIFLEKYNLKPECIEIDERFIQELKKSGFTTFKSLKEAAKQYQLIYTSNVIEHIENDVQALKDMRNALIENGRLVIYVPALPFLFSSFDESAGHFRRYSKRELISKVREAGFTIEKCHYNDSIGVLASLGVKALGYKKSTNLGSKKSLIFYDRCIYPLSRVLDFCGFKHIIGKNLLLVATPKTPPD